MNKQDKIKSRTWRYFIEQKLEEITTFGLKGILIIIGLYILSFFGRYVDKLSVEYTSQPELICESYSIGCTLVYGNIGILILFFIFFIIFMIWCLVGIGIMKWIKSNWKKATKRAREDFK